MYRYFCLFGLCGLIFGAAGWAAGGDWDHSDRVDELRNRFATMGTIDVHLKGLLYISSSGGPKVEEVRLSSAMVEASGHEIMLDWSRNDEARRTLQNWTNPTRHGVWSVPQAEVRGRMEFRPAHEVGGVRGPRPGITKSTPVPVVVVESIEVRLVAPSASDSDSVISDPLSEQLADPFSEQLADP